MKPPMVGVPAFSMMCRSMPSLRIGWPRPCLARIQLMKREPIRPITTWAVTRAMMVRKVRYFTRLRNGT